jgi:hypothetical protein
MNGERRALRVGGELGHEVGRRDDVGVPEADRMSQSSTPIAPSCSWSESRQQPAALLGQVAREFSDRQEGAPVVGRAVV